MKNETKTLMERYGVLLACLLLLIILFRTMSGGEASRNCYFQSIIDLNAELIILDEPTMGLSLSETEKTLEFINNTKKAGKSIVYIDHNLFHVYPVVDRIVVLDKGRVIGQFMKNEITMEALIEQLKYVARMGVLQ